jgi:outer membrane lipoprotein SlyB
MNAKILLLSAACAAIAACGSTPGARAVSGPVLGGAAGAAVGNNVGDGDAGRGAAIAVGGAIAGAATTPSQQTQASGFNRRERYDERSGRYYFYDPGTNRYYYENGQPYP